MQTRANETPESPKQTDDGRQHRRSEDGSTLLIALAMLIMASISVAALVGFMNTTQGSVRVFRGVRNDRYAAAGAIDEAVNWARNKATVGLDEAYYPGSSAACVFHSSDTPVGPLTASCAADPNAQSGIPHDEGLVPTEALLLLGDRQTEPGPYGYSKCASLWDSVANFFTNDTPGASESSLYFKKQTRSQGFGVLPCTARSRANQSLKVSGEIVAAGNIVAQDGLNITKVLTNGSADSNPPRARYGCTNVTCSTAIVNRADGTPQDSDPGRVNYLTPHSPVDLKTAYQPVGFDSTGKLKAGYSLPVRTTAYKYNAAYGTILPNVPAKLEPIANCSSTLAGEPIIFLPGWYQDSEILSRYTSQANCNDRTIWMAPNPGVDNQLLTADDETGAYYLDFTGSTGRTCGDLSTTVASRWCLGGSSNGSQNLLNTKPRVVVGTPSGWSPFGVVTGGGTGNESPDTGSRVRVDVTSAATVDGGFLSYWSGNSNAKAVDNSYATYNPCQVFFGLITCPSFGSRTLRVKDFAPKVTSGPLGEAGYPNGRIFLKVAYGLKDAQRLNIPQVVVDSLDSQGVAVSCGTFNLSKAANFSFDPNTQSFDSSTRTYTFTDAQAKTLADNCGSIDNINNLRVSIQASGNPFNSDRPQLFVDGMSLTFDSYRGASFPVGTDGVANSTQPAKSDCDPHEPGGQLIFGGESNVYIADGSLEVCAGPYPGGAAQSATHQQIGILGVPAVETLRPTSVAVDASSAGSNSTSLVNSGNATRIGEPGGDAYAQIQYPGQCVGFIGIGPCDPVGGGAKDVVSTMQAYSPPTGYRIKKIEARAAYSAEGPFLGFTANSDGAKLKSGGCVEDARTTASADQLRNWTNEGTGNATKLVLYQYGTSRNCVNLTALANGTAKVGWKANVPGGWGVVFGGRCFVIIGTCNYTQVDRLDGVELDVTIEPDGSVTGPLLRPQSGCIIAHPNYGAGEGIPDCALIRADSYSSTDSNEGLCITGCSAALRGTWKGRLSVKGTIYAPSSAIETDDTDIAYPLATRGVILRHLRISGWGARSGYTAPSITNQVDNTPRPRQAIFTACIQTTARRTAGLPCNKNADGSAETSDRVVTTASVKFLVNTTTNLPDTPTFVWWSDRRMRGQ